ncbi:MAG: hypothetical protein Q4F18_02935 [Clostridia bacterium]|nr:hypothetical protein [Clostridia bacterium]
MSGNELFHDAQEEPAPIDAMDKPKWKSCHLHLRFRCEEGNYES